MNNWPVVELGSVATIEHVIVDPRRVEAATPYVGLENIERGGALSDVGTVGASDVSSAKFRFNEKHVLFGKLRPNLAKVARPSFGGLCSTDIVTISPSAELDRGYLTHFLLDPRTVALAARLATGANLPRLAPQMLLRFLIPVPSLPEQRRISRILDGVGLLRRQRRRAAALLDGVAESTFFEMFGNRLLTPLDDRLHFVTSGGRGWARYYSNTGARFIRSLDVRMNSVESSDPVFVSAPDNAEAKRTSTKEGDVLLTITGSLIGRVSTVPASLQGAYVSQHVAILRASRASLRPDFLSFYLSLRSGGQRQIRRLQYGQTKPGLNFAQIRSIAVPDASTDEQDEFLKLLGNARTLRTRHTAHLAELDALFTSLQDRAFRGELDLA